MSLKKSATTKPEKIKNLWAAKAAVHAACDALSIASIQPGHLTEELDKAVMSLHEEAIKVFDLLRFEQGRVEEELREKKEDKK